MSMLLVTILHLQMAYWCGGGGHSRGVYVGGSVIVRGMDRRVIIP